MIYTRFGPYNTFTEWHSSLNQQNMRAATLYDLEEHIVVQEWRTGKHTLYLEVPLENLEAVLNWVDGNSALMLNADLKNCAPPSYLYAPTDLVGEPSKTAKEVKNLDKILEEDEKDPTNRGEGLNGKTFWQNTIFTE